MLCAGCSGTGILHLTVHAIVSIHVFVASWQWCCCDGIVDTCWRVTATTKHGLVAIKMNLDAVRCS